MRVTLCAPRGVLSGHSQVLWQADRMTVPPLPRAFRVGAANPLRSTPIPSRRGGKRRDRRGRGPRGPVLPPNVPGARTGSERFDYLMLRTVAWIEQHLGAGHPTPGAALDGVEFAVEDVPPSAPAPWEAGAVSLGRYFPADSVAGLPDRIVLYRRPIESRCRGQAELAVLLRQVLVEQIAHLTGHDPEEIDPRH